MKTQCAVIHSHRRLPNMLVLALLPCVALAGFVRQPQQQPSGYAVQQDPPQNCVVRQGSFSQCSASCGGGIRTRRDFIVTQASNGGRSCPPTSALTITQVCNQNPCPVPIDCAVTFTAWSTCSTTCGPGTQTRSGYISQQPQNGGRACPQQSQLFQTRACNQNVQCTPVDCRVQFTSFTPCSASCGGGFQTRTGQIITQPQFGGQACPELEQIVSCNTQACPVPVNCQVWFPDFGQCSATCGGGTQTRTGVIEVQPANGGQQCPSLFQSRPCAQNPCPVPVDCVVRQGSFSQCSASCGGGIRTRRDFIVTQASNGGRSCPPTSQLTTTQVCNQTPCPVPIDCQYQLGSFSACSSTCAGGFQTATAFIVQQAQNGGKQCPDLSQLTRTQQCNSNIPCFQATPVDCQVWFPKFGPCSATCGGGTQRRTGIIEVQPANGGQQCPALTQTRVCSQNPCVQFEPAQPY